MIILLIGLVLSVLAVLDIFKKKISTPWKLIWSILVLATNWIGIVVYFFYAKKHIERWCK